MVLELGDCLDFLPTLGEGSVVMSVPTFVVLMAMLLGAGFGAALAFLVVRFTIIVRSIPPPEPECNRELERLREENQRLREEAIVW